MPQSLLQQTCRIYVMLVVGMTLFSFMVFAVSWSDIPFKFPKPYMIVVEAAEDTAAIGTFATALIGGALCVGHWLRSNQPPESLAGWTLVAIVLCVLTVMCLPAIAVP